LLETIVSARLRARSIGSTIAKLNAAAQSGLRDRSHDGGVACPRVAPGWPQDRIVQPLLFFAVPAEPAADRFWRLQPPHSAVKRPRVTCVAAPAAPSQSGWCGANLRLVWL
jgi:hypothetical protein